MHQVIKRHGHTETYDEKKVYASVYAAAIICGHGEKKAEAQARKIMKAVNGYVKKMKKKKQVVTSHDIREQVLQHLKDKETRLIYRHHLDLS